VSKPRERSERAAGWRILAGMGMAISTRAYTEEPAQVGETSLYLLKGGAGPPALVLHGVEGHEGWLAFHEALAEHATVYAPSHPGYGHTDCPDWISSIPHEAVFYQWFLQSAGLDSVDLIGVGMGGWIAAHMAVMCTQRVRHLVLVDATGVRPEQGEILDIFVTPWRDVIDRSFYDPKASSEYARLYSGDAVTQFGGVREAGRTMSVRLCFRPYMYDTSLPGMLAKIQAPTLIVWGGQDQIVPIECATLYQRAIPAAQLRVLDNCGHWAHLEQPQALAAAIQEFVAE
jgi:pimeloyl-ACP methyl ester carboxylesterase